MIAIVITLSLISILWSVDCDLSADQKRRCEQYTTFIEFNSIKFNYGFCLDLNDGNGFTAGRSHFTTKSGDVLEVVKRYSLLKPMNPLSEYESELKRLEELKSGNTSLLKDFERAWSESAMDKIFRVVQDRVNDDLYYRPAMNLSANLNLRTALSKCIIYDTIVKHGTYRTINTLTSILTQNENKNRLVSEKEENWIREYIQLRRINLEEQYNQDVSGWEESLDRVDALLDLINDHNWHLDGPMKVADAFNSTIAIN